MPDHPVAALTRISARYSDVIIQSASHPGSVNRLIHFARRKIQDLVTTPNPYIQNEIELN